MSMSEGDRHFEKQQVQLLREARKKLEKNIVKLDAGLAQLSDSNTMELWHKINFLWYDLLDQIMEDRGIPEFFINLPRYRHNKTKAHKKEQCSCFYEPPEFTNDDC